MSLFDVDGPDLDIGYENLKACQGWPQREIRRRLEEHWQSYQPYADTDFKQKFSQEMESPFWEMYLATNLLQQGKILRPRAELSRRLRDTGPDICILEDGRTVWIEAIAPGPGSDQNPDRIPDMIPINDGGKAAYAPKTQAQLRISGSIYEKKKKYEDYIEKEIISPDDVYIIAVSLGKFSLQVPPFGLPIVVATVYPIGPLQVNLSAEKGNIEKVKYAESFTIERTENEPINRTAFIDEEFSTISGIVWSRKNIGNFWMPGRHDISFVHNFLARRRLPGHWITWHTEFIAEDCDRQVRVRPVDS